MVGKENGANSCCPKNELPPVVLKKLHYSPRAFESVRNECHTDMSFNLFITRNYTHEIISRRKILRGLIRIESEGAVADILPNLDLFSVR